MKIYASQKAHAFPSRYTFIDTETGERGEEPLPPGGIVDDEQFRAAVAKHAQAVTPVGGAVLGGINSGISAPPPLSAGGDKEEAVPSKTGQ